MERDIRWATLRQPAALRSRPVPRRPPRSLHSNAHHVSRVRLHVQRVSIHIYDSC